MLTHLDKTLMLQSRKSEINFKHGKPFLLRHDLGDSQTKYPKEHRRSERRLSEHDHSEQLASGKEIKMQID